MWRRKVITYIFLIVAFSICLIIALTHTSNSQITIDKEIYNTNNNIALVKPIELINVTDEQFEKPEENIDNSVSDYKIIFSDSAQENKLIEGLVGNGYWIRNTPGDSWTITQYSDDSGNQGGFYTIYNEGNGALIVIDGGWSENTGKVRSIINSYGGNVDLWILTHYHSDHVNALNGILANPEGIKIAQIICPEIDYGLYASVSKEWDNPQDYAGFLELTSGYEEFIHHPQIGEVYNFENLHIKFYNTYSERITSDIPNNSSLVFRISASNESMLFVGDFYQPDIGQWMIDTYGDELKSTYMQGCHHGNSIMPSSFYEFVSPNALFFDAPQWLINGEKYRTKDLKAWCEQSGITVYGYETSPNTVLIT